MCKVSNKLFKNAVFIQISPVTPGCWRNLVLFNVFRLNVAMKAALWWNMKACANIINVTDMDREVELMKTAEESRVPDIFQQLLRTQQNIQCQEDNNIVFQISTTTCYIVFETCKFPCVLPFYFTFRFNPEIELEQGFVPELGSNRKVRIRIGHGADMLIWSYISGLRRKGTHLGVPRMNPRCDNTKLGLFHIRLRWNIRQHYFSK